MSNTAVVVAPAPLTTTIQTPAGPLTLSTAMTDVQRQTAIANAFGVGGKAPPTPQELEAANKPDGDILAIAAQVRATGVQRSNGQRTLPTGELDQEAIELVTARYRLIAQGARDNPEAAANFKATFEKDLAELYNGKRLTAEQKAALRDKGQVASLVPAPKGKTVTAPAESQFTPQQWAEGHRSVTRDGWIPHDRINPASLSGYTLPNFLGKDQHYSVSVFETLANARAAGFTQSQIDSYLRAQHIRDGLIKP